VQHACDLRGGSYVSGSGVGFTLRGWCYRTLLGFKDVGLGFGVQGLGFRVNISESNREPGRGFESLTCLRSGHTFLGSGFRV
jgi:hypothetical protein